MSTYQLSKIKTARKPKVGESYECRECAGEIRPGDEYFCYQIGQRRSLAYCLRCARVDRPAYDEHGNTVNRPHHDIYMSKYGCFSRPQEIVRCERYFPAGNAASLLKR